MKKAVSTLLIGSLASLALAGCGTPTSYGAAGPSAPSTLGAQDLSASQMAQDFASQMSSQTKLTPQVQGDQVTVRTADGQTATYDFSQTPQTGMVGFSAGGMTTQFQWNNGQGVSAQFFLPIPLIAVGVEVVWGGAWAFGKYWWNHRDNFDAKDCTVAVVNGMTAEAVGAIPLVGGVISTFLWPIAQKWVDGWLGKHIPYKASDVLKDGMALHTDVVNALKQAKAQETSSNQLPTFAQ